MPGYSEHCVADNVAIDFITGMVFLKNTMIDLEDTRSKMAS